MRRTLIPILAILASLSLSACGGSHDNSAIGVTVTDGQTPAQHINIKLGNKASWRLGILGNNKDAYDVEMGLAVVQTASHQQTSKFNTKASVELCGYSGYSCNQGHKRWLHAQLIRGRYQLIVDGEPKPVIIDVAKDTADLKKLHEALPKIESPKPKPQSKSALTGEDILDFATPVYRTVDVHSWSTDHNYDGTEPPAGKPYFTSAQELVIDLTQKPYAMLQINLSLNGGGVEVRLRPNSLDHPELNQLLYLDDVSYLSGSCGDCSLQAVLTPGTYQLTLNGQPSDTTVVVRSTPATDFTDIN